MAEMPWTCTTCRRYALVSTEARSACPVDTPNWPAEPKLDRAKVGPRGRTCTCNLSVLSGTPLPWATRGGAHGRIRADTSRVLSAPSLRWTPWAKWCRVRDFQPQPLRSERSVSCRWTNAAKIVNRKSDIVNEIGTPGRTLACNLRVRSAALYTLSYGSVETEEEAEGRSFIRRAGHARLLIEFFNPRSSSEMVGRHGAAPCSAV